ncbi:hypothetical protein CSH63_21410 [Micromonospora tulbaghiae]|uniref:RHS repeat-associated core domain-containing protein n=2 Tax=Micromonospora TaxID=1873 RepID=A0A386WPL8_9ACTN|nr:RHS repeat-associated core domain-containing protein [Micromonospora tulbaghiae]AYF29983.1 hypothetical protein CSH63_21410 [Micromonospora tulbaghiae]
MTYHVNDMVHSINQGPRTTTYTLDVAPHRIRSWTDTTDNLTRINHYSTDVDSPSWTDEGGGKHSRAIVGLAGIAGVFTNTTGVVWQITNLHGDLVAGIAETGAGLAYTSEYDEHGNARNSADAGTRRFGWLGTHQRAADTPDGSILMGVRLYNPTTSRFRSVDSVYGGNANPYEYCSGDSLNCSDVNGAFSCNNYKSTWIKGKYWPHLRIALRRYYYCTLTNANTWALMGGTGVGSYVLNMLARQTFGNWIGIIYTILGASYSARCTRAKGVWIRFWLQAGLSGFILDGRVQSGGCN